MNNRALVLAAFMAAAVLSCVTATSYTGDNVHPRFANVLTGSGLPSVTRMGNRFDGRLLSAGVWSNETFPAGQELRMMIYTRYLANVTLNSRTARSDRVLPYDGLHAPFGRLTALLRLGNFTLMPAYNVSGPSPVQLRVMAAYGSRDVRNDYGRDTPVPCSEGSRHDVWADAWATAPRNLAFGRFMVFSSYSTFTVPPFHFRACVRDTTVRNSTVDGTIGYTPNTQWMEIGSLAKHVWRSRSPLYIWRTATATNDAGDYGAVEVVPMWEDYKPLFRLSSFNASKFSLADNIKLVPAGFPCTYEKSTARIDEEVTGDTSRSDQYCGSNYVHAATGEWLQTSTCLGEGSVAGGVAKVGSREQNPFATTNPPADYLHRADDLPTLVGYLQFPTQGDYDVCVSTREYRRARYNNSLGIFNDSPFSNYTAMYPRDAKPVWFKAYSAASSACEGLTPSSDHSATCYPKRTAMTITNGSAATATWSTQDETPATWGEITFTATTGTLNYSAASAWDHSSPREYFQLSGGDMFRLVPAHRFTGAPTAATGDITRPVSVVTSRTVHSQTHATVNAFTVSLTSASTDLTTAGEGKTVQYALGTPPVGTMNTGAGCWWAGDDNYGSTGHFGSPGTQCCTSAPCASNNWCSMTESGNLGATASADLGGAPRVDYSPWNADGAGTKAYGYVRMPQAGEFYVCYRRAGQNWKVLQGSQSFRTGSNNTFTVRPLTSGYTYHFNDSRAETFGPVAIASLAGDTLDKQAWNYYTASGAAAVGSAFKIVLSTESCLTSTAQLYTYSMDPGSLERNGTAGSADDDTTLTSLIHFYVRVPWFSTSTRYRICFRQADKNWHALSDPSYVPHLYMTSATDFGPFPASRVKFTMPAPAEPGMWGQFIFNRTTDATPALNLAGDMVHLVPNVSSTGAPVGCDIVYSTTSTNPTVLAHVFSDATVSTRLGIACATTTSTAADDCYTGKTAPTADSINGQYPYTTINMASEQTGLAPADRAAVYMKIPPQVAQGQVVSYRVCYKQARFANWIQAEWDGQGSLLTVSAARTISFSVPSGRYSGQYSYLTLTASAATPVQWSTDLVKLVDFAATCDATVAASAGYTTYGALSGVSDTHALVDGTNSSTVLVTQGTAGTTTTARAYLTMPALASRTGAAVKYRVCYMARTSTTSTEHNWHDLSGAATPLTVTNLAIAYTALNAPRVHGTLGLRFISGGQSLDTRKDRDAAKIVASSSLCIGHGTTEYPFAALTGIDHQGLEPDATVVGVTDLPGSDAFPARSGEINVVLNSTGYKVCYKAAGTDWIEVLQTPVNERVYALSATDSVISTSATEVSKFTLNSAVAAQTGATETYYGTAWNTLAVGGASTFHSGSPYFVMTYGSSRTGSNDVLKLVRTHRETTPGTFTAVPGRTCFSPGVNYTFATTSGSTTVDWKLNLPTEAGRYLVCVYVTSAATWFQVPADSSSNFAQPFSLIAAEQAFAVTSATTLRIMDYYDAGNGTNVGALAGTDTVYFVNTSAASPGVCGDDVSWEGLTISESAVYTNSTSHGIDTTSFLAIREAVVALPSRSEAFMVCLRRTQATESNTTGASPFVTTGWYQLRNDGSAYGGGSDVLTNVAASQLNISGCPVFNTTYRLRTGTTFDVTVTAQDADANFIPYAVGTKRYGVAVTGAGYALQNYGGDCAAPDAPSFGYTSGALTQFMEDGRLRFRVTALGACPTGGCTVGFTSTNSLAAAPSCTFDVLPTTLKTVRIVSLASTCALGEWCAVRVIAIHGDDGVAYTLNSAVSLIASGLGGLGVTGRVKSTGGSFGIGTGSSANFVNGVLDAEIKFSAASFASLTPSTIVSFTASANGETSTALVTTVTAPIVSEVHVVDIYPVDATGTPIMPLQPSWEPVYSGVAGAPVFRGGDALSTAAVTAAPGYHLVAGQYYAAVLRVAGAPSTGGLRYLDSASLMDTSMVVTMSSPSAALASTACSASSPTCATAVGSQNLAPTMTFTFRVNAASTCVTGVCNIQFLFNGGSIKVGAPTTQIFTPVRTVATKLVYRCAKSLSALATAASGAACPASTVNSGWYINVSAVDDNGRIDRFFDGEILAVMSSSARPSNGARLTTVAALLAGASTTPGHVAARAVAGSAMLSGLTYTRPCTGAGCTVQLLSTWGVGVLELGSLQATPNTARLACTLDTVMPYCSLDADGNCASIAGISAANVSNANSLLYKDTTMCVNVNAVDINGKPTLYETNWVLYYAEDTASSGKQALSIRDENANTDFVSRYKAMARSGVRFCFTVSGTFTSFVNFKVHFAAQRFNDANYWSQGTTGTCSIGALRVWAKKKAAAIGVTTATGLEVITPGAQAIVAAEKTGSSSLAAALEFSIFDHYGTVIATADLAVADRAYNVLMGTNNGIVDIVRLGAVSLRGDFNITAAATTSSLASTVAFTVSLSDFCLGCSIGFTLADSTGASVVMKTIASPLMDRPITSNVSFFVVNTRTAAVRALSFHPGTSPFGGSWINDTAVNGLNNTGPTTHLATCAGSTCKPAPETFNLAKCDSRGTTYIGASATTPLQMRVMVLDPGFALSELYEPDDSSRSQVDILNTYSVATTFGNQIMECVSMWGGGACIDDKTTAPKQVLAAYGSTVRAAIAAFASVTDSNIRATNFMLVGLSASAYLAVNASTSTLEGSSLPSIGGAFNATASSTTTTASVAPVSLEQGNEFFWRPVAQPSRISILDIALDADPCAAANASFPCFGGAGCTSVGLGESGTIGTGLVFNYSAQRIPTNLAFPMTVEVLDEAGLRVFGAAGSVTVAVESWTGCNNGGEVSFSGSVVNGRATLMLTFTTPCQNCIMQALYTPAASQAVQHAAMLAKPAGMRAMSKPVMITSDAPAADHVIAVSAVPAALLQANTTTEGTVGTEYTVTFAERGVVGQIPVVLGAVTSTIRLALQAQTSARNWWIVGNGGVLRPSLTSSRQAHHQVAATGANSLAFYFTRTCHACRVHATYTLPGKATVAFPLPTVFVIATTASQRLLVGFRPSHVQVFNDVSFSVWATGSDAADIAHAGTAVPAAGPPTPSFSIATAGNGDGGTMSSNWWSYNETVAHRVTFTLPCSQCNVGVSGVSVPIRVFTQPSFLQPIITPQGGVQEPISSVSIGSQQSVEVRALDDAGYVGEMYGATGTAFPGSPFKPLCCAKPVSFAISHDSQSPGGFPRTESTFIMADATAIMGSGTVARGVGTMSFNFSQPVRNAFVLFDTADITSRTTNLRPRFPQPRYSISVGTSGLTLRAVSNTDVTRLTSTLPFAVDVALTGNVGGDSSRSYVATAAGNNVTVSLSSCPPLDASSPTVFFLDRGYARVNLTFAAGDATGNCRITFTANAGTGSCSGAACSSTFAGVSIRELAPASFRFLRPGTLDNGRNSTAGVFFGAAGRQTRVTVQLYGADAFGNQVPVRSCATCRLEVRMDGTATDRFASCALNTEAPASFNENGTATVAVLYQDNAQPTYLCNLRVVVFSDVARTTPLLAPDLVSQFHTTVVTICRPAKVAILTNTSTIYRGVFLRTGVAYDLFAVIQDANGNTCYGDSQDEATRLTVEAVDNDANLLLSRNIVVVNVNDSDATTTGFLNGWRSNAPARTEVRAVNGGFNFRVVLSNSTVALGLSGIRLRVTARSATPAISGSAARAYSSPLDTIIAASKLRFAPSAAIPPNVVTGRTIQTGLNGAYSTDVVVQAVDGLDPAWVGPGLLTSAPNIARAPTAFGNNEEVFWKVLPAPASGAFPIGFTTGRQLTRLSGGESRWSGLAWNGPNGIYTWSVATTSGALAETTPVSVACQQVDSLRIDTAGFAPSAPVSCRSGCQLPSTVFPLVTNETVNSGTPTYAAQSLQPFTMTVALHDSNGAVVLGDSESVVMVELVADSRTTVQVGVPPSLDTRGPLYVRVRGGRASFTMAFAGSTALGGNADANATFRFTCPVSRPAATLLAGEPTANPCAGVNEATTLGFAVVDVRLPLSAHTSPSALAVRQVIKFSSALTSHQLFNQSHFRSALVPLLRSAGFGYVTSSNIGRVLTLLPCTTTSVFDADLGTSVCEGSPRRCSASAENLNCPSEVLSCACPVQTRSLLLSRYLLQSGGNSTGPVTGGKTAIEMSFNLANADAFPARNATELADAYTSLAAAAAAALRDPSMAEFVIDPSSIGSRSLNALPQTAPPAATPTPPTTTAPTVIAASTTAPEASPAWSYGWSVSSLCVALLLTMLAAA